MNDEVNLRSVFEDLRAQAAPAHTLDPVALMAAGQRMKRRRVAALVAAGIATIAIVSAPLALRTGQPPGPGPAPVQPAEPLPTSAPSSGTPPVSPAATPSDTPRMTHTSPSGPARTASDGVTPGP